MYIIRCRLRDNVCRAVCHVSRTHNDIVLRIVIRCVGTKRPVKMPYSKGTYIFFRSIIIIIIFFLRISFYFRTNWSLIYDGWSLTKDTTAIHKRIRF